MPPAHLPHRRRLAWSAALFLVLGALAGCGSARSSGDVGSGPSRSAGPTGPAVGTTGVAVPPVPPSGAPAPLPEPPGSVFPTPAVSDPVTGQRLRRIPWRLVSSLPSDTFAVVEVAVGGIPCDRVTGVEVAETASTVTVTVWAGPQEGATGCDGPQPAMAQIVWVRVPLAAPLGSRSLLPAPIG